MSFLLALLSVCLPLGAGSALLYRMGLSGRVHPTLWLGAAYGTGFALISFVLATLAALKVPLTLGWAMPAVIGTGSALWLGAGRLSVRAAAGPEARPDATGAPWVRLAWWVLAGLLVLKVGLVGSRALDKPVMGWDAWTTHSLRAKAIFYDQTVLQSTLEWIGHSDYPLGGPLLELWVSWFQGRWDDTAIKILFPGFLVALLAMTYGALRERLPPIGGLLGAWFAASLPLLVQHATEAYLDLPLAYAILGTSIFLWRYSRTNGKADLVVASLMAAFGVWIKREGAVAFGIELVLLAFWVAKARSSARRGALAALAAFSVMPAVVWAGWAMVRWSFHATEPLSFLPLPVTDVFARLVRVVAYAGAELWTSQNWSVVWPLVVGLWLLHARRSFSEEFVFFGWPILLMLGAFLSVSAASPELWSYLHQGSTLHRIVLQLAPLAVMFVAMMAGEAWATVARPGGADPAANPSPAAASESCRET